MSEKPPESSQSTESSEKPDLYELRARERERWSRGGSSRRSSRSSGSTRDIPPDPSELGFRNNYLVVGLLGALGLLLLSEVPQIIGATRLVLAEIGTILILLLIGMSRGFLENIWVALRRGPNPWIIGLVTWSVVSFFLSPFREFAFGELLRVLAGAGAYLLAAYTLKSPRQISYVLAGLLIAGVSLSLYDLAQFGQQVGLKKGLPTDYSVFGTHENIGSLLVLLLPFTLAFAFHSGIEEKRRLLMQATTLILGCALLLARTRSAWLAGLVALSVLAVLFLRYGPRQEKHGQNLQQRLLGSPVLLIAGGFLLIVGVGGLAPLLSRRFTSIMGALDDDSFAGRLVHWSAAARMFTEKVGTGWGLGTYTVIQGQWTHTGDEIAKVVRSGTGHENIAHNYYVQWAAETGAVGIVLYVGVLLAFLFACVRALKTAETPFQVAILCGGTATIAGALIDSIGSPAYNFHGVSTLLWVLMGLTIGGMRPTYRAAETSVPALAGTPLRSWFGAAFGGLLVAGIIFYAGNRIIAEGKTLPRGTLQIIAEPSGPIRPGASVSWQAVFTDGAGKERATMPGTIWDLQGDAAIINRAQAELTEERDEEKPMVIPMRRSVFRVLVPASAPGSTVTAHAIYRDQYNRRYEAWSMKTIGAGSRQ